MSPNYNINDIVESAYSEDTEVIKAHTGVDVINPITFKGEKYQFLDGSGKVIKKALASFRLPNSAMAKFRRTKVMKTTALGGSSSTVKEIFSFNDWTIEISGFIIPDPGHPTAKTVEEQKKQLQRWDDIVDSINVQGQSFVNRRIYRLVIDELWIDELRGNPKKVPFVIKAKSDEAVELIINS